MSAPRGSTSSGPYVELRGISKRFGGVQALSDVSLTIARGSIHALVGENGAGKSTLGKILAGGIQHDAGELIVGGRAVRYRSPHDALVDGVTIIAQELALVPQRTVLENVFLGVESRTLGVVDRRALLRRYERLVERSGFALPPSMPAGALRLADQQKLEIMRAIARDARLIVMDEPTAGLATDEAKKLFADIRRLQADGVTIVYVSHFLDEVLSLADTVTVLRDGCHVRTAPAAGETRDSLIGSMLGRPLTTVFPPKAPPPPDAPAVLSVRGLVRGRVVRGVDLDVRAGEIVGMAGLIGSGRSEVARAIYGADHRDAGAISVCGRRVDPRSPRHAARAGISLLPESRKHDGLVMLRSGVENITLPHLDGLSRAHVVAPRRQRGAAAQMGARVGLRAGRERAPVFTLSGGNQQKVLFAKALMHEPRLLIADEPTRGVDVGAKEAIYELIVSLAAAGMGVLLISSELEEVLGLAHRVLVMREGRLVGAFADGEATEGNVMSAAFGAVAEGRSR
ncbi:MAG: sugar ABC transporter ATP-binding protein [Actinobacteria bacterium]|nr:sugar ABC transporter ATP-binding protein [Actinomycetota bacterium]